jgi:hypothetical protein
MSAAEISYRCRQAFLAQALKRGLLRTAAPRVIQPVGHPVAILPPATGIEAAPYLQEADCILNGKVILFAARQFDVGSPPEWNRDPLSGIVGPSSLGLGISITNHALVGDIKHVWELNRHLHLVRLAQAYVLSGEQRYLDGLARQLSSWFEQCPPLMGPNWTSSLEAGIRLINWSLIWQMLGGWEGVLFKGGAGEQLRTRWLESVFAHCQFIRRHFSRHSSANNHLIGELAGLYVAARTWPYWAQFEDWAAQAKSELEREAVIQHSTDGVNREQAFAYQVFAAEFLVIAGIYGQRSGDPFSVMFWDALRKAFGFLRSVRDVGGHVPMVGDADDGMALRLEPGEALDRPAMMLALSDAIFGESSPGPRTDTVRWLLGDAGSLFPYNSAEAITDWQFPDGGYFLFGSDFAKPDEVKGVVDCGPLGYLGIAAHGHADALAITLSICGEECLVDPGTFSYWNELKWRDYFRGTSAHNTVTIDGQNQSVSGGRFMWTRKARARIEQRPVSPEQFDFVGSHDGYMRLADPVRHTRSVRYDQSTTTLLVRDEIAGEANHEVEQFWHFAPDVRVELSGTSAVVTGDRFSMLVDFSGKDLELALFEGSENPPLGWFSRTYEAKVPSTTLRVRTSSCATPIEARFDIKIFQQIF